jgi:hypothetical protein
MRYLLRPYLLFIATCLFAACHKDSSVTGPAGPDNPTYIETADLKQFSDTLITAFKTGQKSQVLSLVSEESRSFISGALNDSTVDMPTLGSALEKRRLTYSSDGYAVYAVMVKGQSYHVAYAKSDTWQLVR